MLAQAEVIGITADHGAMDMVIPTTVGGHMEQLDIYMDIHTTLEQDDIMIILIEVGCFV
jgi:hypothetical protein